MKSALLTAALPLLVCPISASADTAASSSADKQRFAAVVRRLEASPLNPALVRDRAWAVAWLIDEPDVSVKVCSDVIGDVSEESYAYVPEIVAQYSLAMGAFIIEHPDRKDDNDSIQIAGVRSALAAYHAMNAAQPSRKSPALERLVRMQEHGELLAYVHQAYLRCRTQGSEDLPTAAEPSRAPAWEEIWDQPDIATIYVDRSSVTGSGDSRSITTRTIYRAPLPEGHIAERVRVEEFDCAGRRSRVRRVTIVASDGRPPRTIEWRAGESEWKTYESDTLGAAKGDLACAVAGHPR